MKIGDVVFDLVAPYIRGEEPISHIGVQTADLWTHALREANDGEDKVDAALPLTIGGDLWLVVIARGALQMLRLGDDEVETHLLAKPRGTYTESMVTSDLGSYIDRVVLRDERIPGGELTITFEPPRPPQAIPPSAPGIDEQAELVRAQLRQWMSRDPSHED